MGLLLFRGCLENCGGHTGVWTAVREVPIVSEYMGSHTKSTDRVTAILDSVRRIVRVLRVGSRAAEKTVGLSGAQLFVLRALKAQSGQSLNELAERTRTHQSSVSVVVQRLVDRGLVLRSKSKNDARQLELSLSPAGVEILRDAPDAVQDRLIAAVEQLSATDQKHLGELLSALVTGMGAEDESVEMFFEGDSQMNAKGQRRAAKAR